MADTMASAVTGSSVLDKMFRPRSVAIIGASPNPNSSRNILVRVLQKHGFAGTIYPVNPSHKEIEGLQTYASVDAISEVPDLALVITPAETVADIIAACGRKTIPAAIVYSAGFEEVASGKENANRLREAASRHHVAVLGPNCQGLWSLQHKTVLSFSAAALGVEKLKQAPIAVVSQSGALSSAIGTYLQKNGIGCSYIVSVGNETCMDMLDALSWLIEQDDARVVALYLEGLKDASRILPIAERARERGVQIVALKAGKSAVGQKATASHTGKIASAHAVYADVFEQAGIISVSSLADVLAAIEVLAYMKDPRPSDDRKAGVAVLSSSGGAGALLADQSEEFGIAMSEFSPATTETLEQILPEFAHKANPVDLTGQIYSSPNLFRDACAAIGGDPRTQAMVVQFAGSGLRNIRDNGDAFRQAARDGGYPMVISFVAERVASEMRESFRDDGILLCDDTAVAMRALSWLYARQRNQARPRFTPRPSLPSRAPPSDWPQIMALCEDCGVAPARWTVLEAQDRAATACSGMAFPLVVKVLPSDCDHKTELGLVKLRVRTDAEVDAHAVEFRRILKQPDLRVLIQEMVEGGVEVVLSCLRNGDFGPILSIGSGGVAIELYRDVAHLALPTSREQVLAALKGLKLWTLLQGYRGRPPADAEALAAAAVRLGDMFLATPTMAEFEINPVIVRPAGEGVVAVDALVVTDPA